MTMVAVDSLAGSRLADVKTYLNHGCSKRHRSYAAFARCAFSRYSPGYNGGSFRRPVVHGDGEWAFVSWCGCQVRVELSATFDQSRQVLRVLSPEQARLDGRYGYDFGCGMTDCRGWGEAKNACRGKHQIVRLDLYGQIGL